MLKGGYVASGSIQAMSVDLLIDSGSDVTLIDVEVYNQIPECQTLCLGKQKQI